MAELPDEICNSRIEELNVRNNLIDKLPEQIGRVPLKKLFLKKNPLSVLPKSFGDLKGLALDLDWLEYIADVDDILFIC